MRAGRNEARAKLAGSPATNSAQLRLAHRSACGKCGAVKADLQIGLEQSPEAFVAKLVAVFREVRRVLRPDGTLWLNIGDSYASRPNGSVGKQSRLEGACTSHDQFRASHALRKPGIPAGLKHKDLIGIPWMLAFALRADGWCLRQEIIWNKPNAMPESVKDRCTKSHETIFLLSKSARPTIWQARDTGEWSSWPNRAETVPTPTDKNPDAVRPRWEGRHYYFDQAAIAEERSSDEDATTFRGGSYVGGSYVGGSIDNTTMGKRTVKGNTRKNSFARLSKDSTGAHGQKPQFRPDREVIDYSGKRNKRSVWTVATAPFREAHFATYPPDLIRDCILAGAPRGGLILDPFGGAGTTALVAERLGRDSILIELNPDYAAIAQRRLKADLARVSGADETRGLDPMPLFQGEAA
jgi:DNA modification methylase